MTGRMTFAVTVVGAALGLGVAASVLHAREVRYPSPPPTERLLYLRSGGVARRLMLSFDGLAADIYWIRAIQHYGRDASGKPATDATRFELLEPLLDLTTTLDPHFNIAYRFGAIFLALPSFEGKGSGPGRPDLAIKLLEKGLAKTPERWQYAHDAGFVHYFYTGNFLEASRWFERAAAIDGAPPWLAKLAADTRLGSGDRDGARRMLQELARSEERYIQKAAERGLQQLDALDRIDQLQAQVNAYYALHHKYPFGWVEFQPGGMYPKDPSGTIYSYDQKTGNVSLSKDSPLYPLPNALAPKAVPVPK
jgi:tetratricopeptide (TPR) repeat protein